MVPRPRSRIIVVATVVAVAITSIGVVLGRAGLSSAATDANGMTWADDFDGAAGSAPDPGRWSHETGGSGNGNNELEYYTTSTSNAALDGQGHLVITARQENPAGYTCWYGSCTYTSARLNTAGHFTQAYGRFEARIKLPRGSGLWPAFWLLGDNIGSVGWPQSGEMDVMENVGREPGTNHGSLHGPGYSGGNPLSGSYSLPGGAAFADDFHTFAIDWAPDSVAFSVDGHEYEKHTPADTHGNQWVFNHPFFIILNVAVGGSFPGSPDGSASFPQQMVVDYVHVFASPGTPATTAPTGGPVPTGSPTTGPSTGPTAAPPPGGGTGTGTGTGAITGLAGKCVDVRSAHTANRTRVQLFTCNATSAQQWTVSGATIMALGKCLDVSGAGTADGTRVQLYQCNGTAAQDWTYTNGELVNPHAGKCLDVTDNQPADWTPLQLWTCAGTPNQKWTMPAGPDPAPPAPPTPSAPAGPAPTAGPPPSSAPAAGAMAAAPYFYLGWGNPPDPRTIMSATGVRWFTLAFMLDSGGCNPAWDGGRPLTGAGDQSAINAIRAAGGDVVVSFGGASGPWLEQTCGSAAALAGAYQKVVSAYGLKAIDIDIEGEVYGNPTLQQRTVDALKTVKANNPGLVVYVTLPSGPGGPDGSLINRAAQSGLTVDGWTIMPFDFGGAGQNMGALTVQAAEGLKNTIRGAYGYTDDQAYRHAGISSMNGITDEHETVTVADFQTMLSYAQSHHLARLTFWSANRDRGCADTASDGCSGVSQSDWAYTAVIARYHG
jgi:beta-glucanase (GH16 family)